MIPAVKNEITPCINFIQSIFILDASLGRYSSPCINTEIPEKESANAVREKENWGERSEDFEIKTDAFPTSRKEEINSKRVSFFISESIKNNSEEKSEIYAEIDKEE